MSIVDLFESVAECGCAAKVPAQQLAAALGSLAVPTNPAVLVGPDTLDDAGVYQLSTGQCLVQTVDFFPPVARRPEDYGKIAAANSLSDVYAMGGTPLTALAVVCVPSALIQAGVFGEIIRGASEALREAGCVLLGGHSVLDPQLKFGLAVTGVVDPAHLFTNANARPGDLLILTKPIGTGATIMAIRAGMATGRQEAELNRVMATLNRVAAELAHGASARCVTDITGFGLLGHALQMARASGVALQFAMDGVPLLEGAMGYAEQGLLSAATYHNRAYVGDAVHFDEQVALAERDLLFDPQTSGGLLVCCPAAGAAAFVASARERLNTACSVVGRVVEAKNGPLIHVARSAVLTPGSAEESRA
jgi:selenide, water dikinase